MSEVSNQEVNSGVSEPDFEASVLMEDQQQSVTASETSLPTVDQNAESADQNIDKKDVAITAGLADSVSVATDSDSVQEAVMSTVPDRSVKLISGTTETSVSVGNTCRPIRIMSAVSSSGQTLGVSLATKSPAFVFCQVTSGGLSSFVPHSAVGGIQLSSGTAASSTTSISHVPVFRSTIPLRTVLSDVQGIATVTSASSSVPAIVGIQTSAGVRLLRQAADGVRVVAGTTHANRAGLGLTLNRGTAPQRLALAIAPANSTIRPAGIGSIRLLAVRNGTPVAISSGGSAVGSPQLKLLTPAVPLSGVRPSTSSSTGVTASSVPASASAVSTARQQTAVNDVQAYLRRIEELKSAQPDQGAKTPVTLAATVRTPLKAKTALPTTLATSQQIVVLQPGSQPQLANISASQLVSIFVASCCYLLLYYVICNKSFSSSW